MVRNSLFFIKWVHIDFENDVDRTWKQIPRTSSNEQIQPPSIQVDVTLQLGRNTSTTQPLCLVINSDHVYLFQSRVFPLKIILKEEIYRLVSVVFDENMNHFNSILIITGQSDSSHIFE